MGWFKTMEDKKIINEIKQDFKSHEEKYRQIEEMVKNLVFLHEKNKEITKEFGVDLKE